MRRALRILMTLAGSAALTACITAYELPPNAQTAKLNVKAVNTPMVCLDGQWKRLTKDENGYATIAAGQRITVGAFFHQAGYNVTYECRPRISFVPWAGSSYYQDFEIEGQRCMTLVYREVSTNPTGLAFVDSLDRGAPACPAR